MRIKAQPNLRIAGLKSVAFIWHGHEFHLRQIKQSTYQQHNMNVASNLDEMIAKTLRSPDKRIEYEALTGATFELKRVGDILGNPSGYPTQSE